MAAPGPEQEFVVRVPPRDDNKRFHVMKFNASNNVDFSKWTQARMVRENNEKILKQQVDTDDPKFGAGSVFGKDMKEEARRKKLGINMKKYNPDAQPWLMRVGGKGGRKFKGVREGGVSNNTTYYVFTHGKDGAFEAYPINEWYNFSPIMRYKTLDADEAEEKFAQRGKILNKWAVMVNKKLKPDQEGEEDLDGEEGSKKKGKKEKEGKDLKISDMDDWDGSDDGLDTDDDEKKKDKDKDDDSDDGGKKKRSKDSKKKSKKRKDDVDEAFEDSDEDEMQTREVDYMSDESSDSEEEMEKEAEVKGVDQDEGLSKMLDSESSSSDEDKDKDKDKDDEDDEDETGKKKKKKSSSRANSDDEGSKKKKTGSANSSRSGTPTKDLEKTNAEKRKALVANILDPNAEPSAKKSRLEQFGSAGASNSLSGNEAISEEAVRRYLKRRPMTTTDLLKKFRSKKTGIQNAQLVQLLANILKKINPHKQKTKGVTYLSLKEGM